MSSDGVPKVTPDKLANMTLPSIKILGFYDFQVSVVVADGATKKILSLKEFQQSLLNHIFQ